jgi:UDP-N-acetyl-D-mannosaminuronate dehydrogenase
MRGSTVLVMGLTYKPDIADDRETPATAVIRNLRRLGSRVVAHDPFLDGFVVDGVAVEMSTDLAADLAACDLALVLQHHSAYDLDAVAATAPLVFDTRGTMRHANATRL